MQTVSDNLSTPKQHLLVLLLTGAAILIAYSNTFRVPFVFDDYVNIVNNPHLKINSLAPGNLQRAATESPSEWRWLPNISFALNYYFGGRDVWGYHLVNLVTHLLTASVFYFLAHTTLSLPSMSARHLRPREIAFAATLLWAVHPVQTNAVTYIVQRMTSMATLFSLCALLCYINGRLQQKSSFRKHILFGTSLVCWLMALVSKENSAIMPVIVLGYELFFLGKPGRLRDRKKSLIALGAALFCVVLIGWIYLDGGNLFTRILDGYANRPFTLTERLLTESRVLFHYLGLLILPLPSRLQLDYNYVVSTGLWTPPQTIAAIVGLIILCLLAAYLYQRQHRLAAFAIFWFLVNLAIESTFVPLELVYEHRLYLPSAFPILAAVAALFRLVGTRTNTARSVVALLACVLVLLTWQRNATWASKVDFWRDAVAKSPGRARVHVNLAMTLKEEGDYTAALQHLHRAIELDPEFSEAYLDLGLVYKDLNLLQNSLATLNEALTKSKVAKQARIHYALGLVYGQLRNYDQAISHAETALHLAPDMPEALVVLGAAFDEMGQPEKAYAKFEEAEHMGHDSVNLYINWALTCKNMGKIDEALNMLNRALSMYPDEPKIHYLLSIIYREKRNFAAAEREFALFKKLRKPGKPLRP